MFNMCMKSEGRQRGIAGGLLWGGVAVGGHHLANIYQPEKMVQRKLVAWDLLDAPSGIHPYLSSSFLIHSSNMQLLTLVLCRIDRTYSLSICLESYS